jgi:hypothetical protein
VYLRRWSGEGLPEISANQLAYIRAHGDTFGISKSEVEELRILLCPEVVNPDHSAKRHPG